MDRFKRQFTVNQVVDMLDDDTSFRTADIFIEPPPVDPLTDEDSGEEDGEGGIHNLNGRQLAVSASATIVYPDGRQRVGDEASLEESTVADEEGSSSESSSDGEPVPSTSTAPERPSRLRKRLPPKASGKTSAKRKRPAKTPPGNRDWRKVDLSTRQKSKFPWISPPANTSKLPQDPVEMFELFYDDDVIELIRNQSEVYAAFKGNHSFAVSKDEIRTFLAILLISGYSTVPRRRMYWSNDPDVRNAAIAGSMTRDRFDEIMKYCHVRDNTDLDTDDKMSKLRPLLAMINERCLTYFLKEQNLSIDESMIPYFGRHGAKQFIRGKPIRFGFKMWVLTTSLGYVVQFEPYQGAKGRQATAEYPGLGMGGSVVVDLIAELTNDQQAEDQHTETEPKDAFHLTFDNLFTSLKLVDCLSKKGIGCTGTIRSNRIEDCPVVSVAAMQKEKRGTYDFRTDNNSGAIVVRWNDNNVVNVVSNKVGVYPVQIASRWSRSEHKRVQIPQPAVISHYNKTMGGVDRMDQNVDKYRVAIRSKKWWWAIFCYCLDMSVQQAWHLYRATPAAKDSPLDLLGFRRAIAMAYVMKSQKPNPGRPLGRTPRPDKRVPNAVRFDGKNHLIQRRTTQRRCAACGKKARQMCSKCNVGLHDKCFMHYHTK